MNQILFRSVVLVLGITAGITDAVAGPVAAYSFNNTFSSSVLSAPDLQPVNPLETNGFVQDSVSGYSQTV